MHFFFKSLMKHLSNAAIIKPTTVVKQTSKSMGLLFSGVWWDFIPCGLFTRDVFTAIDHGPVPTILLCLLWRLPLLRILLTLYTTQEKADQDQSILLISNTYYATWANQCKLPSSMMI